MKSRPFPRRHFLALLALIGVPATAPARAAPDDFFTIQVVDEATGRGIPLVRLETTDRMRFYTDSAGRVAIREPGLMDEEVWLTVSSHGYEYPHESFGARGTKLRVVAGDRATLKVRRQNIAQRLYRVTGRGIYRDTLLAGEKSPLAEPALAAKVMGQDSAQTALYRGKLYWFWGDTNRPGHPLGNFFTTGAVSELPGSGGLDPDQGVNLRYFTNPKSGFVRSMARLPREGSLPIWVDGVATVEDGHGGQRLLAHFSRVRGLRAVERGLLAFNDGREQFDELKTIPLDARLSPAGHALRAVAEGQEYLYFSMPYPAVRVRNTWSAATDPNAYEGFTCLQDGADYSRRNPPLDRDADGKPIWKWRKNTPPLTPAQIDALVASGAMERDESPFRLRNVVGGKPLRLHGASVYWNEHRRRWLLIGIEVGGESMLGEVWLAEAKAPEGPWIEAVKIATHAQKDNDQDFYNPVQHPYFAAQGGRRVYFEGTYTYTFSGQRNPTPLYEYNQLMYAVDLDDPLLKLPEPPPGLSDARPSKLGP